jgi:transposase InsO family protein
VKFVFIRDHESVWPVHVQCDVLDVSRARYYAWKKNPRSHRAEEDDKLKPLIQQVFDLHHGRYGSPRITYDVKALGGRCTEKRVARLMREMGLTAHPPRTWRPQTTDSNHDFPIADNLLNQDFTAEKPNQKWVGDITYLPTNDSQHKWVYLATVIDLFSRKVVGWACSTTINAELVCHALSRALKSRRPSAGLIFHSDRGSQYASLAFRDVLQSVGIQQSMSRTGNCYDNAVAESFFHTIKNEWLGSNRFANLSEIEIGLLNYIDGYYNRRRRHSSCRYLSPIDYEQLYGNAA